MDDILASIRRILNDDEAAAAVAKPASGEAPPPKTEEDGVLVLDDSMMIASAAANSAMGMPEPAPDHALSRPGLLAPESEAAAAASVGTLLRTLTAERDTEVHRGGPTIEDLVREGIRPLLKNWLDVHLPPLVERLVRAEIDRISGRAAL